MIAWLLALILVVMGCGGKRPEVLGLRKIDTQNDETGLEKSKKGFNLAPVNSPACLQLYIMGQVIFRVFY